MPWPLSQDYNEAIQNPAQCFADPELRQGEAETNTLGLPAMSPRPGFPQWTVYELEEELTSFRAKVAQRKPNANGWAGFAFCLTHFGDRDKEFSGYRISIHDGQPQLILHEKGQMKLLASSTRLAEKDAKLRLACKTHGSSLAR
jgi:hypothetical protein